MTLPRGPEGEKGNNGKDGNGKSAYELWLDDVAKGIDNPKTEAEDEWPKGETDVKDFYRFLAGKDGSDGGPGKEGAPGKEGEPGKQGEEGDDGDDGAPGQSAFEMWVADVTDANGLDNPHTPLAGDEWPRNEISLADFWRYLSGDGGQSSSTIVDPGAPGQDFPPVSGKPNVIAQYTQKEYSEYVSTSDGSVSYKVFMADGTAAPDGTVVGRMPGIATSKTYTLSSGDGTFKVPKGDLPTSGGIESRYGSAEVNGIPTATNTYVPQRIAVRLMIGYGSHTVPTLTGLDNTASPSGGVYMTVPVRAQRRVTGESEWTELPAYLPNIARTVHAYEVDLMSADPAAPDLSKKWKYHSFDTAIALTGASVGVRRPTVDVDWIPDNVQDNNYFRLDGNTTTAFIMVIDDPSGGLYGEKPAARDVINYAPVNLHPLPENLVMETIDAASLRWTQGSFHVDTNTTSPPYTGNIETSFLFAANYYTYMNVPPQGGVEALTIWNPDDTTRPNSDCLGIAFKYNVSVVGTINMSSIGNPDYTVDAQTVYVGSQVYLRTTSMLISGPGLEVPVGTLIANPDWTGDANTQSGEIIGGETQFIIRKTGVFDYPDIPIYDNATQIP